MARSACRRGSALKVARQSLARAPQELALPKTALSGAPRRRSSTPSRPYSDTRFPKRQLGRAARRMVHCPFRAYGLAGVWTWDATYGSVERIRIEELMVILICGRARGWVPASRVILHAVAAAASAAVRMIWWRAGEATLLLVARRSLGGYVCRSVGRLTLCGGVRSGVCFQGEVEGMRDRGAGAVVADNWGRRRR